MPKVLVVGAGPVGLTLAAELARHGIRCRIIDRLMQPSPCCQAIGVTPHRFLRCRQPCWLAHQSGDRRHRRRHSLASGGQQFFAGASSQVD